MFGTNSSHTMFLLWQSYCFWVSYLYMLFITDIAIEKHQLFRTHKLNNTWSLKFIEPNKLYTLCTCKLGSSQLSCFANGQLIQFKVVSPWNLVLLALMCDDRQFALIVSENYFWHFIMWKIKMSLTSSMNKPYTYVFYYCYHTCAIANNIWWEKNI